MALLKNCDNIKFDLLKDYAQLRLKFSLYPFGALLYFPEDILFLFGRRLYCPYGASLVRKPLVLLTCAMLASLVRKPFALLTCALLDSDQLCCRDPCLAGRVKQKPTLYFDAGFQF